VVSPTQSVSMIEEEMLLGVSGFGGLQVIMLVLAIAGLSAVMISTHRRSRKSQRNSKPRARDRYARIEKEQGAKRDLEQVMLELDQLSRQIHGRIDTKLARLDIVIRDADQRIKQLSGLIETLRAEAQKLDLAALVGTSHQAGEAPSEQEESRYTEVYRLADRGLSPVDIARNVGRTAGEIELILALRKTKSEATRPAAT